MEIAAVTCCCYNKANVSLQRRVEWTPARTASYCPCNVIVFYFTNLTSVSCFQPRGIKAVLQVKRNTVFMYGIQKRTIY
jgi:hypothetical protein